MINVHSYSLDSCKLARKRDSNVYGSQLKILPCHQKNKKGITQILKLTWQ